MAWQVAKRRQVALLTLWLDDNTAPESPTANQPVKCWLTRCFVRDTARYKREVAKQLKAIRQKERKQRRKRKQSACTSIGTEPAASEASEGSEYGDEDSIVCTLNEQEPVTHVALGCSAELATGALDESSTPWIKEQVVTATQLQPCLDSGEQTTCHLATETSVPSKRAKRTTPDPIASKVETNVTLHEVEREGLPVNGTAHDKEVCDVAESDERYALGDGGHDRDCTSSPNLDHNQSTEMEALALPTAFVGTQTSKPRGQQGQSSSSSQRSNKGSRRPELYDVTTSWQLFASVEEAGWVDYWTKRQIHVEKAFLLQRSKLTAVDMHDKPVPLPCYRRSMPLLEWDDFYAQTYWRYYAHYWKYQWFTYHDSLNLPMPRSSIRHDTAQEDANDLGPWQSDTTEALSSAVWTSIVASLGAVGLAGDVLKIQGLVGAKLEFDHVDDVFGAYLSTPWQKQNQQGAAGVNVAHDGRDSSDIDEDGKGTLDNDTRKCDTQVINGACPAAEVDDEALAVGSTQHVAERDEKGGMAQSRDTMAQSEQDASTHEVLDGVTYSFENAIEAAVEDFAADAPHIKYWMQRYRLFDLFDHGIVMDAVGWYSVTPEIIAEHHAERCRCEVVVDAFCGVGGNAIQLAQTCSYVIAIELDPARLVIARHNAEVYGVADRIEFICGNAFDIIPSLQGRAIDVVLLSPPWGGPSYSESRSFHLSDATFDIARVFCITRKVCANVVLFMPKNTSIADLAALATPTKDLIEIEQNFINRRLKTLTMYTNSLVVTDTAPS
eukprot:m.122405 g.122405  ORF g.122405 m.122405 type:complete len:779 (-) comp13731_c0_seq1:988-3324(-)